jgi:hypothetical protein
MLDDIAEWELLFRGEEVFWKSAGALREAGYTSVLSLTQDIRMFIPKGIKGITEDDRATLQAWLELVDWTGRSVSRHTQAPRKLKLHINPKGRLNQWLTRKEPKCDIKRDDEAAQSFVDNQRALELLANTISNLTPIEASNMKSMSGGEVLGAALITWLKDTEETIEVARKVVGNVWPRLCEERSQSHPAVVTSCKSKLELTVSVEKWM